MRNLKPKYKAGQLVRNVIGKKAYRILQPMNKEFFALVVGYVENVENPFAFSGFYRIQDERFKEFAVKESDLVVLKKQKLNVYNN